VKGHIQVLFTGGTISMRIEPSTGAAVPALSGEEIVSKVPGLKREAHLILENYARLPGPHVTPHWMWQLREHVATLLEDPAVDGIVITHGTDTLEETAFLLDLTLESPKPVVFCGAMRTVSDPSWDGPWNLRLAVRTAIHEEARGRGVLIAVGEQILSAAEATKWHAQKLEAFRSPLGPVGVLDRGRVVFARPVFRSPRIPAERIVAEVDIHQMAAGVDDFLIRASIDRGVRGLVIAATGAGNVPPGAVPGLRGAVAARIPVVLVTRCAEGRVAAAYGYEGGGMRLQEMGVIFGGELPPAKARIKLMVALGLHSDPAEIRPLFE
jgi:L-asparaginase